MENNINKEKAYKIIAMVLSVVMVLGSLLWIAEKGSSAAESNAEDTTETQEAIEKESGSGGSLFYQEFPAGHYGAESRGEISRSILSFLTRYYS